MINDPDPALRRNRLLLLSQVRATMDRVADFSRIEG
jgi:glycyl-tRNA synthetase beta chain